MGNPFADGMAGISKTSDDGFVVVGDSYISELQQWDVYAAKFNKSFVLQWTSAVGFPNNLGGDGNGYDDGRAITETSDKGFIITGLTNSFDGVTYMYIVRLKKVGTIKWTKIISQ